MTTWGGGGGTIAVYIYPYAVDGCIFAWSILILMEPLIDRHMKGKQILTFIFLILAVLFYFHDMIV